MLNIFLAIRCVCMYVCTCEHVYVYVFSRKNQVFFHDTFVNGKIKHFGKHEPFSVSVMR